MECEMRIWNENCGIREREREREREYTKRQEKESRKKTEILSKLTTGSKCGL